MGILFPGKKYEEIGKVIEKVLGDSRFAFLRKRGVPPSWPASETQLFQDAALFLENKAVLLRRIVDGLPSDRIHTLFSGYERRELWKELCTVELFRKAYPELEEEAIVRFVDSFKDVYKRYDQNPLKWFCSGPDGGDEVIRAEKMGALRKELQDVRKLSCAEIRERFSGEAGAVFLETAFSPRYEAWFDFASLDAAQVCALISCAEGASPNSFITKVEGGQSPLFGRLTSVQWMGLDLPSLITFEKIRGSLHSKESSWDVFQNRWVPGPWVPHSHQELLSQYGDLVEQAPREELNQTLYPALARAQVEEVKELFAGVEGRQHLRAFLLLRPLEEFQKIPVKTAVAAFKCALDASIPGSRNIHDFFRALSQRQKNDLDSEDFEFLLGEFQKTRLQSERNLVKSIEFMALSAAQRFLKGLPPASIAQSFSRESIETMSREDFKELSQAQVEACLELERSDECPKEGCFTDRIVARKPLIFSLLSKEQWQKLSSKHINSFVQIARKVDFAHLTITKEEFLQLPEVLQLIENTCARYTMQSGLGELVRTDELIAQLSDRADRDFEGVRAEVLAMPESDLMILVQGKGATTLLEKLFFRAGGKEAFAAVPVSVMNLIVSFAVCDGPDDRAIITLADRSDENPFPLRYDAETGTPTFFSLLSKQQWGSLINAGVLRSRQSLPGQSIFVPRLYKRAVFEPVSL